MSENTLNYRPSKTATLMHEDTTSEFKFVMGPVGGGKAQPLDAKVLTPTGFVGMGDLRTGDLVVAPDGSYAPVTGVFPQGVKDIVRVTFSDGASTECCMDHLWLTKTYAERSNRSKAFKGTVRTTAEIAGTLVGRLGSKNHTVPIVKAADYDKHGPGSRPLDPYTLGVLLGDGCLGSGSVTVSTPDREVIQRMALPLGVQARLINQSRPGACPAWAFVTPRGAPNPVILALSELGLRGARAAEKHVPEQYLQAPAADRLELLRGLMDTDGSCSVRGRAEFYTSSPALAHAVAHIVSSLGGTCSRREKNPAYTYRGQKLVGQKAYALAIKMPAGMNPFALPRKAANARDKVKYPPVRYVVSVEPVGRREARCISVGHPDSLYVTDDFIVTHNTSLAIMDVFFTALRQEPDWNNRRRTRWVFVRNTFPQLKSTVIKTFEYWLGAFTRVVYDTPIRASIEQPLADGTILDVEFLFLALDDDKAVAKLRSLEVTGAMFSEMSEITRGVVEMTMTRIGRYPAVDNIRGFKGPTWKGVIAESNPPSINSWIYTVFEEDRPEGYRLFRQPPALIYDPDGNEGQGEYLPNPEAENVENIGAGFNYYFDMLKMATPEFIKVYILGEYGVSFEGRPVFPRFRQTAHVANAPLAPAPSLPIVVGLDFGLSPAAAFTQLQGSGVALLHEIVPQDTTLEEFITEHLLPTIQARYRGHPVLVVGDPAGNQRSALANMNSFQMLRSFGISAVPALTNDIETRLNSVNYFLQRVNGFLIDPSCRDMIEGFSGGYRYKKRGSGSDATWKDTPEKNKYSHGMDAAQYACMTHWKGSAMQFNTKPKVPPRKPFAYV